MSKNNLPPQQSVLPSRQSYGGTSEDVYDPFDQYQKYCSITTSSGGILDNNNNNNNNNGNNKTPKNQSFVNVSKSSKSSSDRKSNNNNNNNGNGNQNKSGTFHMPPPLPVVVPRILKHKRRYCKAEGCNRIVKSQGLCQRHGAKPRKCKVDGCSKQAQGNFSGMCKSHYKTCSNNNYDNKNSAALVGSGDNKGIREDFTGAAVSEAFSQKQLPQSHFQGQVIPSPKAPAARKVKETIVAASAATKENVSFVLSSTEFPSMLLNRQQQQRSTSSASSSSSSTTTTTTTTPVQHNLVESVYNSILPNSLTWKQGESDSADTMPLVAHLKRGYVDCKPFAWHRNEERQVRGLPPVTNLGLELEDWERDLAWMEALFLTGVDNDSAFHHLAQAWGKETGFHLVLARSICASRTEQENNKATPTGGGASLAVVLQAPPAPTIVPSSLSQQHQMQQPPPVPHNKKVVETHHKKEAPYEKGVLSSPTSSSSSNKAANWREDYAERRRRALRNSDELRQSFVTQTGNQMTQELLTEDDSGLVMMTPGLSGGRRNKSKELSSWQSSCDDNKSAPSQHDPSTKDSNVWDGANLHEDEDQNEIVTAGLLNLFQQDDAVMKSRNNRFPSWMASSNVNSMPAPATTTTTPGHSRLPSFLSFPTSFGVGGGGMQAGPSHSRQSSGMSMIGHFRNMSALSFAGVAHHSRDPSTMSWVGGGSFSMIEDQSFARLMEAEGELFSAAGAVVPNTTASLNHQSSTNDDSGFVVSRRSLSAVSPGSSRSLGEDDNSCSENNNNNNGGNQDDDDDDDVAEEDDDEKYNSSAAWMRTESSADISLLGSISGIEIR